MHAGRFTGWKLKECMGNDWLWLLLKRSKCLIETVEWNSGMAATGLLEYWSDVWPCCTCANTCIAICLTVSKVSLKRGSADSVLVDYCSLVFSPCSDILLLEIKSSEFISDVLIYMCSKQCRYNFGKSFCMDASSYSDINDVKYGSVLMHVS